MKFVSSVFLSSVLLGGVVFAGSNATFIGIDLGGTVGSVINLKSNAVNVGTGVSAGLRAGYQAFFNPRHGVRFYLSYLISFNAPSYAVSDEASLLSLEAMGITNRVDINVDYLYDFINQKTYSFGIYAGLLTGYVLTSVGNVDIGAITAGLNLGFRATVGSHNRFELGVKGSTMHYLSSGQRVVGFYVFIGGNYSVLF